MAEVPCCWALLSRESFGNGSMTEARCGNPLPCPDHPPAAPDVAGMIVQRGERIEALETALREYEERERLLAWAVDEGISVFRATDRRFYARKAMDHRSAEIVSSSKNSPYAAIAAAKEALLDE